MKTQKLLSFFKEVSRINNFFNLHQKFKTDNYLSELKKKIYIIQSGRNLLFVTSLENIIFFQNNNNFYDTKFRIDKINNKF